MRKSYLLAYDDQLGTRDKVKSYLESMQDILHWRYDMPHSFYVISEADAGTLATRLRELAGESGKFVFCEFTGNEQGWLTEASWYLINHKRHRPKTR
jgi:hypothetical protein